MIDARRWVDELKGKLVDTFGERLLFVGFQGSYKRGEATEESDIDVVAILDRLDLPELSTYRALVAEMPHAEMACGFIAGRDELQSWPRFEIFQMGRETEALHGSLAGLLPPVTEADVRLSVQIAASGLYHLLCHTYLYGKGEERTGALLGAYKSLFFVLQLVHYLATGIYCGTKAELLEALDGAEVELLRTSIEVKRAGLQGDPDEHFRKLIGWASATMRATAPLT